MYKELLQIYNKKAGNNQKWQNAEHKKKEIKPKMAEALKGVKGSKVSKDQNRRVQKLFQAVEKTFQLVYGLKWRIL